MIDYGKRFEEDFVKSVPDHVFAYRVHDSGGLATKKNNRFTQKNLCDYIMYDGVGLYLIEMKSHKGPSIPKDKLSQLEGLLAIRKDGVGAWFALNYRDYDVTYMLSAECVADILGRRASVPLSYCEENGILVPQELARTRWRYDLSCFFVSRKELFT